MKISLLPAGIYHHITVFEEVGHGGCASIPQDVMEVLSVDMGCVGEGLGCDEYQVFPSVPVTAEGLIIMML
mgnify:CR=1 FL=1